MEALIENTVWTEKYRPITLDDIVLSEETRALINKFVSEDSIPNLFLCSRPGQGKTSLAKVIARHFECDTLYINCSDENNVDTVRNKVTNFSRTMSSNGKWKVVILDEADGFANIQAQKILRGLMEEVHEHTRFIITANYKNRIIEALRSRCSEIDINPPKKGLANRLIHILKKEGIAFTSEHLPFLKELINVFYPDFRTIVKELQLCVFDGELRPKTFKIDAVLLREIFDLVVGKQFNELRKHIINNENVFNNDYSRLLSGFYNLIIQSDLVNDQTKAEWTIKLAEHLWKSESAIDQELNAIACFYSLILSLKDE